MKTIAKVKMGLSVLPIIIGGVIAWVMLAAQDHGFLGFLAFAFVCAYGIFMAWLSVLEFYAFGELVETVVDINVGMDMMLEEVKKEEQDGK